MVGFLYQPVLPTTASISATACLRILGFAMSSDIPHSTMFAIVSVPAFIKHWCRLSYLRISLSFNVAHL